MSDIQVVLNMYEDAAEAADALLSRTITKVRWGNVGCCSYVCQACKGHGKRAGSIDHAETCPLRMLREALAAHRELEAGE